MDAQQQTDDRPAKKQPHRFGKGNRANPNGRPRGSKNRPATLSIPDAITALQLAKRHKSPAAIARALGARLDAVKDALAHARLIGEAYAPEVMMNWIRSTGVAADQGDHKPAMALLQSIEVVKPIAQTYDTGGANAKAVAGVKVEFVNFGFAGLPPPAIDVTTSEGSEP